MENVQKTSRCRCTKNQEYGIEEAENLVGEGAGQPALSALEQISNTKFFVHDDIPFGGFFPLPCSRLL